MKPLLFLLLCYAGTAFAQTTETALAKGSLAPADLGTIDLPTALKLAGADSLAVLLTEEKLREAQAREEGALWQLFPTLSPGIGYRNHSGRTQAVTGQVLDADKASLAAGGTVQLQLELGEAVYRRLAAQQTTLAAGHGLVAQRRRAVLEATLAYLDLGLAEMSARLHEQSIRVARDYHAQVARAVTAGLASKSDELRASAQLNRAEVQGKQAGTTLAKASTRLCQLLRLKIVGTLRPMTTPITPLSFPEKDAPIQELLQKAMARRPELAENESLTAAAGKEADGARYGPLYPTLGAQYFAGGLGGSSSSARQDYASSTDTSVTLSWRIGAGGLFDHSRQATADARERQLRLRDAGLREQITREVVDAHAEAGSFVGQLELLRQQGEAADSALQLALRRKEFAVGVVLEAVQSQQDALQAKFEYLKALTEANKAQYRLRFAIGD